MDNESSLQLNEFQIHSNQNEYIVENVKSAEYYEMNESAVAALKLLDQGKTLDEVERVLLEKFPQDDINVYEFVQQLTQLDFISGNEKSEMSSSRKQSLLNLISPEVARIFFNPIIHKMYLLLFLTNVTLLLIHPELFPHFDDLFVTDSLAVSTLTYLFVSLTLIVIHEMGHVLAVRSKGLSTGLSINHRLFLVVIETDMTHAWRLNKQERNLLYLSGICFDTVLVFVAIVIQLFSQNPLLQAVASLIMLDLFIKFVYQCCVYMKTDFYYVLENSTGCYNLMERSRSFLNQKINADLSKREQFTFRFYGLIYFCGVGLSMLVLAFYVIPQLYYVVKTSLEHLSHPIQSMVFWDGFVILLQLVIGVGLLLFTWSRSLLNRQ